MRKKGIIGALTLFLIGLSLLYLPSCEKGGNAQAPEIGKPAPDFRIKDLNGGYVSLDDYAGKVVLLEFWATWCPPCRRSIPEMEGLFERTFGKDFAILGISVDEGDSAIEKVKAFTDRYNIRYKVLIDSGEAGNKYKITTIPAFFLLDKSHKIVKKYEGFMPGMGKELENQINALLQG
ncbi:MAG: TlpA family protein disulfide reductase [Nitrospirae bacterium]|nr:MAG: TlpA family protein disulfide reductase [Nitrospirota bacterium]